MENQLQVFTNEEFESVRKTIINEQLYFVGSDVAKVLGYTKPNNALKKHVDEEDCIRYSLKDSRGKTQEAIFINESGLYSLILSSRKESAKNFKEWVIRVVLPSVIKFDISKIE